ncbi:MAG: DHH family phosphoesterase [Candidatus Diapherotrites archaeon]|nr:DHH family phosphoesterase [Candidatus Diapherotrites archaeon]
MSEVARFLKGARSVLLVTHKCPDPDAVGSCAALAMALEQLGKSVMVLADGSLSEQSKALLASLGYAFSEEAPYDVDLIVVLDTNSPLLFDFEAVKRSGAKKVLIDHHSPKGDVSSAFDAVLIDEAAVSVTQILFGVLGELGVEFTPRISLALAAGIVTDSANFIAATADSFEVLARVLKVGGIDFQSVIRAISAPMDVSEKIAQLKGAQRLEFERVGDLIVAWTKVSAFEGAVAKRLINLGADVSFVAAVPRSGEVRISSRARSQITDMGLHLGRDVMPSVSGIIEGDAGGHAAAAGSNGVRDDRVDDALRVCVGMVKAFFDAVQR